MTTTWLHDYQLMQVGDTHNGVCPKCHERKLYVTRKADGHVWLCFRASCGYKGFAGSSGVSEQQWNIRRVDGGQDVGKPGNPWMRPTMLVDYKDLDYFDRRFNVDLGASPVDAAYYVKVTDDGRYAFPLRGPQEEPRGVLIRRPIWSGTPAPVRKDICVDSLPKALNYWNEGVSVRLAWYHSMCESDVVIVEDVVSAMAISSAGFTSVALLGTNFRPEFVRDILRFKSGESRYILALDPDALTKSLKIASIWGSSFKKPLRVAHLQADPKDMDTSDLLKDLGL